MMDTMDDENQLQEDGSPVLMELRDVGKRFPSAGGGEELCILQDINLTLRAGSRLAILGPSGSGKSTLLNLMGSLDRPSSGSILLEGQDLGHLKDQGLARVRNEKIGFVFQQHHLLPQCSVLENVLIPTLAFGRGGETAVQKAKTLLEQVGLQDRMGHFPGQISGGECQRVAVVRALINDPLLLLADEPTGALDEENARGIGELLIRLNEDRGVTLVVVTHSRDLASQVGSVHMLRHKRLEMG
jgi:ABC-type lipoprotein export system ATPase subunit